VRNGIARLASARPRLAELALGGTAVGTGLNAPAGFADAVIARLAAATGHPFVAAPDRFEALAARDAAVEASAALAVVAVSLTKIANDLRWMASGPRCGLGEIALPALQPGSSIMPGKVNPVIPEMVLMVCAQVIGHHQAITLAGMSGNFELNVAMPLIVHDLLESIELLARAARLLAERCVAGVEADREHCAELVERSLALVTALAPRIGYDRAAEIAREALATGKTVREICLERRLLPPEELARLLDARAQTGGGGGGGGGG
jgi:fumarate hydratase class II